MFKRPLAFYCFNYLLSLYCYSSYLLLSGILAGNLLLFIVKKIELKRLLVTFSLILLGLTIANYYQDYRAEQLQSIEKSVLRDIEIRVLSDVAEKKKRVSFTTSFQGKKLKVSFKGDHKLEYGDRISLKKAKIFALQRSKNFQISNYDDYLFLHGFSGKMVVYEKNLVDVKKARFSLLRAIFRWKNSLVDVHKKSMAGHQANLLGSIIFGTSASPLDRVIQDSYKKAGIIHLLVVSGSQIAIMVGLAFLIAKVIGLSGWSEFLFVSMFNLFFTISTGGGYSIVRAAIMAEITLSARLFKRQKDFYTTLLLSGVLLSLANPKAVFDIGYQLSFMATFSLIYLAPLLQQYFKQLMPKYLAAVVSISTAPLIMTMPLTLYHFNAIALFALPVNILIAPWVEFLVVSGFVSMLLGKIWLPLAVMLNTFNGLLITILDQIVDLVNSFSISYLYVPQINLFSMIGSLLLVICFAEFIKTQKKIFFQSAIVLLIILLILPVFNRKYLKITILDVGQGDCILIESGTGRNVLVDAGSDNIYGLAESTIRPILVKKNIRQIDYLIVTHPHFDHYSAVSELIDLVTVKTIVLHQNTKHDTMLYSQLLAKCRQKDISLIEPQQLLQLKDLQGIFMVNLFSGIETDDCNELSSVWLLKKDDLEVLLTGDTTSFIEANYLIQQDIENIEVLKVAHHGSKTASEGAFLEHVRPSVAVISVGSGNKHGLPSEEVVQKLSGYNCFRTDLHGAVEIAYHNDSFTVSCFDGSYGTYECKTD